MNRDTPPADDTTGPASPSTPPRARRWQWRDAHAWHALAVASLAIAATGGVLYGVYWWRVARTARRAGTTPQAARDLLLFGKRLVAGAPDDDLRQRVSRVHRLLHGDPARRAWLLGGRTTDGPSEAEAARDALAALGLPDGAMLHLEQASAHTLENLRHARALILAEADIARDASAPAHVAIVTSRYHLYRCAMLARQLGLAHELVGAEDRLVWNVATLRALSAEAMLTLWIDVGARYARLIGHRGMIARVS